MALLDSGMGRHPMLKFFLNDRWLHGPLPDSEGLRSYVRMLDQLRGQREIEWFCAPSGMNSAPAVVTLLRTALELGGHVRVGIGDTPTAARGRSNRELVEEVVALAAAAGRSPATPREIRRRFGRA
jgi:uncharacterized protein (DUF849 family)